jgi:hypothetical protein
MITAPTVLVLGAGASMPFNFPSGAKLLQDIINLLPTDRMRQHVPASNPTDLMAFQKALSHSGVSSIDAFLEHRPEFIEVGKIAIALCLMPCEKDEALFQSSQHWYQFLFQQLNASFNNFGENKLGIITYNYDRSLEYYLVTALQNKYGKDFESCLEQFKKIDFIHLHGFLGDPFGGDHMTHKSYSTKCTDRDISVGARNIKIIHESIDNEPQFQQAHDLLINAKKICFLGFGYNETNLNRLMPHGKIDWRLTPVYGTAFKLGKAECDWIKFYFKKNFRAEIQLGDEKTTIETFLRDYPAIINW